MKQDFKATRANEGHQRRWTMKVAPIVLWLGTCGTVAAFAPVPSVRLAAGRFLEAKSPDAQEEQPQSLLQLAGEAKLSGALCVGLLVSCAQTGGDNSIDAALRFPPGGPLVLGAAGISGLYTLWKVQPVLAAVQATVARQDAERLAREKDQGGG